MRKIVYTLIAIVSGGVITSCSDLDLTPIDYYGSGNFWKSEAHIIGAINGAHAQFRGHDSSYWKIGEWRAGTMSLGPTSALNQNIYDIQVKSQDISEERPNNSAWFNFYGRIFNLNDAIENITKANYITEENRNYYLGQVYGLRAWYYFLLYKTYGGVPIKTGIELLENAPTTAEPLYTPRSTPKQTLDFVKGDIAKSQKHFEDSGKSTNLVRSKWSYYATLMLKAEIYLWSAKVTTGDQTPATSDLDISKDALDKVRNSGKFSLLPNYADVFDHTKKENNEIIFTMAYLENEASTPFGLAMYYPTNFTGKYDENGVAFPNNDPLQLGGGGTFHEYKFSLFESFDAQDTRRSTTFLSFYSNAAKTSGKGVAMIKYLGFINSSNTRVYSSDIPVYRYADLILMYAEIVNKEGGDPAPYINEIRQRAYGTSYTSTNAYTNSNFADNELAILKERDKEFVAESKRWYDLLRLQDASGNPLVFSPEANYGVATPILNQATEAHKVLWPVDREVMNRDPKVKQTPGY